MVDLAWHWRLEGSPEALWPWVSDTDFINHTAGLSPVAFSYEALPSGGRRRLGAMAMGPFRARWVEHPFHWMAPGRLGVRRDFLGGPLLSYRSEVSLQADGPGHARLSHRLSLQPRWPGLGLLLRLAGRKLGQDLGRAYRAAEAAARLAQADAAMGPVPPQALAALAGQGAEGPLALRLLAWLLHAPSAQARQLRPFALADAWGQAREEVLGVALAAVRAGLAEARWALRCPHCLGPKGEQARLQELEPEAACTDCQVSFGLQLDQSAELLFRPSPALRPLEALTYCVGGPGATPQALAQGLLLPGEERLVVVPVGPGLHRLLVGQRPAAELLVDPTEGEAVVGPVDLGSLPEEAPMWVLGGDRLRVALVNGGASPLPFVLRAEAGAPAPCLVAQALAHPDLARSLPEQGLAAWAQEALSMALLLWGAQPPEAEAASAWGAIACEAEGGASAWAFYDPWAALRCALALGPSGWALELGPLSWTGQGPGRPPRVEGAAAEGALAELPLAPPGVGALAPLLAEDLALQSLLAAEGWVQEGHSPLGASWWRALG